MLDLVLLFGGPYHGWIVNDPGVDDIRLRDSVYRRHFFIDHNGISIASLVYADTDPSIEDFNNFLTEVTLKIAFCAMNRNRDYAELRR